MPENHAIKSCKVSKNPSPCSKKAYSFGVGQVGQCGNLTVIPLPYTAFGSCEGLSCQALVPTMPGCPHTRQ